MVTPKIALLLPDLRGGGAERVAVTLANAFIRRGFDVDVVLMSSQGPLQSLLERRINVVNLDAPRIRNVPLRLAAYLKAARPVGILALMWPLTVAAVIGRTLALSSARLVLSEHSTLGQQYTGKSKQAAIAGTTKLFYPYADARTTVSEGAARDLSRISKLPRSCFEVISNPLDLPPFPLPRSEVIEQLWSKGLKRVLTVGSLKPEKDHALLIRSFAKLPSDVQLIIVGEGEERDRLQALASDLGVEDRVQLPGFHINPWPFLASADLFVLSSRFEGLPLVLVEALHAGLPIVSTDCPSGPREILAGGEFGRLVPVGDEAALTNAMQATLAEIPDRRGRTERAEQLASHASVDRYLELLTA